MARSVFAVIAGYLVMGIAIMVLMVLWPQASRVLSSTGFMLLNITARFVAAVIAGYITGLVARQAELKHAAALVVFATVLALINFLLASSREPLWYQLANFMAMVLGVLWGGYLRAARRARAAARAAASGLN
ncbi:MAG: hypothetical protein GTN62_04230 [Gemmatimonadales bacterium]|nr:hypothetical protein [Gemmatimonadales bacterium]NIN10520.1 hypothetical protein [Gemmatimonadales bacterium]NIN49307.1 hypothetical protein [Gemmatimonadales bacterium]NIP06771.1 hypothetical protein [Gemmatimonadales bacterium]NIR02797.1 hypothetical protein [Gemmatimonadales bacterium]